MSRSGARRGEGAIGQPQVEIESQGAALKRLEGVYVNRYGVADDLLEELLAQFDLAFPQHRLRPLGIPPELASVGDGRGNELLARAHPGRSTGHGR